MRWRDRCIIAGIVVGVIGTVTLVVVLLNPRPDPPIKYPYYTCNKDQVNEIVHNQPDGILEAIKKHCATHEGGT